MTGNGAGSPLLRFHDEVLVPALELRLDAAFPEFDFVRGNDGWWIARAAPNEFDNYGHEKRKLTANTWGFRSYKSSRRAVSWIDFVNGGAPARGSDYVRSLVEIGRRLGIDTAELEVRSKSSGHAGTDERARRSAVFETFLAVAMENLRSTIGDRGREYLARRGFDGSDFDGIELGYIDSIDAVRAALRERGVEGDDLEASGLLRDSRWQRRVIGALRGPAGQVGTFFARSTDDGCGADQRYLYLARPPRGWAESRADLVALGADRVRSHRGPTLIVEGVLAALKLRVRGLDTTIGLGGDLGLLTQNRWRRLAALGMRRALLVADNDPKEDGSWPGREGLLRALENLRASDVQLDVTVLAPELLGDCKGPDDYVDRHGAEAFGEVLEQQVPALVFDAARLIDDVTPDCPEHARRDAAARSLERAASWGPDRWRSRDLDLIVSAVCDSTGFDAEVLDELLDALTAERRDEEASKRLGDALREARRHLDAGGPPAEVASRLRATTESVTALQSELPPEFSVELLLEQARHQPEGLSTGFAALDAAGVELVPGQLTIAAARTGHGKTTFATSSFMRCILADSANSTSGLYVMLSYEEPALSIFHRLLAQLAPLHGARWTIPEVRDYLRARDASRPDYLWPDPRALQGAIDQLRDLEQQVQVVYAPQMDIDATCAYLRHLADRKPLRGVFADYVQRIRVSTTGERRDIDVSAVARSLKHCAVELDVPFLVGAQVNREAVRGARPIPEGKPFDDDDVQKALRSRRPQLHHLREGGSEQEADQILGLLLLRQDYVESDDLCSKVPDETPFEVSRLKVRFGASSGTTDLVSDAPTMRVLDRSETRHA